LYFLDISWGDAWASPSLRFCPFQLISSFSNPYTWKLPSYKTKHKSIRNISVASHIINLFLLHVSAQNHHIYIIYYCSNFPKSSVIKRTQKKAIKRQTQIFAEICQNRTADKGQNFEVFSVAQIKKCSTNESLDITWGIYTRNRRSKR
jgi:hypothetical protein